MRSRSVFGVVSIGITALLLVSAPASATSTASATLVFTLDFQGAFFTDTLIGAVDGTDYQLDPLFNWVDSPPQSNTGVGSAAITGNIMVNGSPLKTNIPLQEDDQIIFTISGNASATGPGSDYSAFYENNAQIYGTLNSFVEDSLTFVFDWSAVLTTTLDSEPIDGDAFAFSDGSGAGGVLWGSPTGFAFGDGADGIPTMPGDNASGQIQIVVNFLNNPDFNVSLNHSLRVRAVGGAIPEPSTALLLGLGSLGLLGFARRVRN